MGLHTFGKILSKIAISLENPVEDTGRCLRSTSATLLVDADVDVTTFKRIEVIIGQLKSSLVVSFS